MILFSILILSFGVAWSLGANDVANSMGTSVGSGAITLKKALIIAGILELSGSLIFGKEVTETLATKVANPLEFQEQPFVLFYGMIAVLITCAIWLQVATRYGLPVASSHAVVGAIAGFSWIAKGSSSIDFGSLTHIGLAWIVTPFLSGLIALFFYFLLNRSIFSQPQPLKILQEVIPWLSAILFILFGVILLPELELLSQRSIIDLPPHTVLFLFAGGASFLSSIYLLQKEYPLEKTFAQLQVMSACFVAFAHGSNDVGNAIAPLAVIQEILTTNTVPLQGISIPFWILLIGGLGIVTGLAIQGKNVIATVGEGIIPLTPMDGFCAEMATATTVLLASRLGLPVSTSHALVGGVIGVGLWQGIKALQWSTIRSIILAWLITLPIAIAGSAFFYTIMIKLLP